MADTSINPRFRFFYTGFFVTFYIAGISIFVESGSLLRDLADLSVAVAAISFIATEVVEVCVMLYEAYKEMRSKRLERVKRQYIRKGDQQGYERARKIAHEKGLELPEYDSAETSEVQNTA